MPHPSPVKSAFPRRIHSPTPWGPQTSAQPAARADQHGRTHKGAGAEGRHEDQRAVRTRIGPGQHSPGLLNPGPPREGPLPQTWPWKRAPRRRPAGPAVPQGALRVAAPWRGQQRRLCKRPGWLGWWDCCLEHRPVHRKVTGVIPSRVSGSIPVSVRPGDS